MNLDRERLQKVLAILGNTVGNKVMEVAKCVKFMVDSEKMTVVLSTTDFHAFQTIDFGDVSLAGLKDVPEVFLINHRELSSIVRNSTTETVSFELDSENIKVVTNGEYQFRMYEKVSDFPTSDMEYSSSISWDVPTIQSAWNKSSIACSKDVTKLAYQGIYFDGNFVATDNRRLAIVTGDEYSGPAMLIPPVFGSILKHCSNTVSVGINNTGNLLVMTCKEIGLLVGVRLIDATFVDYNSVLESRNPQLSVTLSKYSLLSAVQRLSIFSDKLFKVVTLKLSYTKEKWKFSVSIDNKDAGREDVDVVDIQIEDEGSFEETKQQLGDEFDVIEYNYHIDNLIDGVRVIEGSDDVVLTFQQDGKLWVEEENFKYVMSSITI